MIQFHACDLSRVRLTVDAYSLCHPGDKDEVASLAQRAFHGGVPERRKRDPSTEEKATYIRMFVFCPIAFIDFTYVLDKSIHAVECLSLNAFRLASFRAFPATFGEPSFTISGGGVFIVPSNVLAWYKKLSRWRMSRFDTLFGFGASSLFFLAIIRVFTEACIHRSVATEICGVPEMYEGDKDSEEMAKRDRARRWRSRLKESTASAGRIAYFNTQLAGIYHFPSYTLSSPAAFPTRCNAISCCVVCHS